MRRLTLLLAVSLIALAVSAGLAVRSFMGVLSSEANVKVRHSCVKVDGSEAVVTFVLSSPREGRYHYAVYCNYTDHPFSYASDGNMWAGGSFTYTLYVRLEPNRTLAVNIRIWWEGELIDEVTHYVRAGDG